MRRPGTRFALGLLSLLVVAEGVAIIYLLVDRDTPPVGDQGLARGAARPSSTPDLEHFGHEDVQNHSNKTGGFGFSVPESWEVASDGPNSQAVSPDNVTTLTVSSIPAAPIKRSVSEVLEALRNEYKEVSVRSRTERVIDGYAAEIVRGTVVREENAKRFVLGVVAAESRTHLLLVFARFPEANSVEVSAGIQEIFGSFSVLPTPGEDEKEKDGKGRPSPKRSR